MSLAALDKRMPSLIARAEKKKVSISIGNAREVWKITKQILGEELGGVRNGAAFMRLCSKAYKATIAKKKTKKTRR